MSRRSRVAVACAADAAFAMPLAVTIRSLLDNLGTGRSLRLWVVDAGLGAAARARLERSWRDGPLELSWVEAAPDRLPDLPLWGRMQAATYLRLLVGELLPAELDTVIWLDSDLLVRGDLGVLWESPFDGHGVLAVQDLVVPYVSSPFGIGCYRELGLAPDAPHFNAGVMAIDLRWWRRHDVARQVLEYLGRHRDSAILWDQEGLNAVLAGAWGALDPRWNQIASVCGRTFFRPPHLSPESYRRVVEDPLIVHHAGSLKPWLHHCPGRPRAHWFAALERTDWAGWRPRLTARSLALSLVASRLRTLLHPLERPLLELSWRRRGSTVSARA